MELKKLQILTPAYKKIKNYVKFSQFSQEEI